MKSKQEIVFIIILMLLVVIFIFGLSIIDKKNKGTKSKIECLGYNYGQVYTFCRYTDYLLEDFIKSKGIRKQFDLFQEGKIMFLKKNGFKGTVIKFDPVEIDNKENQLSNKLDSY